MSGANDDLFHNLKDLDDQARNALKLEQWAVWIGGAYLAYVAFFRTEHLMQYLGFGCLYLLFRVASQIEQLILQQKRNEAVLQTIRRKVTEIKPDTDY